MKRKFMVVILLVLVTLIIGCAQQTQTPDTTKLGSENNVRIRDFKFVPETLSIRVGDTITWANEDSAKHTVTSENGDEIDSEELGKGGSFTHTFNEPGEYTYYCSLHPSMKARIIVK